MHKYQTYLSSLRSNYPVCVCWDNLVNMWRDDTIWIDIEYLRTENNKIMDQWSLRRNNAALYNVIWGFFVMSTTF